jgi:hypothetical protein
MKSHSSTHSKLSTIHPCLFPFKVSKRTKKFPLKKTRKLLHIRGDGERNVKVMQKKEK